MWPVLGGQWSGSMDDGEENLEEPLEVPLEGLKARPSSPRCGCLRGVARTIGRLCQQPEGPAASPGLPGVAAGEGWRTREGVRPPHKQHSSESPLCWGQLGDPGSARMAAQRLLRVCAEEGQTLSSRRASEGILGSLAH